MDDTKAERNRWTPGTRPPQTGLAPHETAPPLEDWITQERRRTAERVAAERARAAELEHIHAATMARARAWRCDDGTGKCSGCGVVLGADDRGRATHPDNGCHGPALPTCEHCGKPYTRTPGGREVPTCSPDEHEQRKRENAWALATRERNPLAPPPRVYKDD